MADDLKYQKGSLKSTFACRIQKRLKSLECPLIEGADESYIGELVLTPGEPRIRILQWLLSRFHPSAYNILDPLDMTGEGKLKVLLKVAAAMGLCRPADLQLIEGRTSLAKQISFIDKLLDVVGVSDVFGSPATCMQSSYNYQRRVTPGEQSVKDSSLLDFLVQQEPVSQVFPPHMSVLPADVKKCVDMTSSAVNADKDERGDVEMKDLMPRLKILQQDLSRQNELLKLLNSELTYRESDTAGRDTLLRKLKLIMSELEQMMTNCKYCYENHIEAWCGRDTPSLSPLGDQVLATQRLLNTFTTVLGAIKVIKTAHQRLEVVDSAGVEHFESEDEEVRELYLTLNNLEHTLNSTCLRS